MNPEDEEAKKKKKRRPLSQPAAPPITGASTSPTPPAAAAAPAGIRLPDPASLPTAQDQALRNGSDLPRKPISAGRPLAPRVNRNGAHSLDDAVGTGLARREGSATGSMMAAQDGGGNRLVTPLTAQRVGHQIANSPSSRQAVEQQAEHEQVQAMRGGQRGILTPGAGLNAQQARAQGLDFTYSPSGAGKSSPENRRALTRGVARLATGLPFDEGQAPEATPERDAEIAERTLRKSPYANAAEYRDAKGLNPGDERYERLSADKQGREQERARLRALSRPQRQQAARQILSDPTSRFRQARDQQQQQQQEAANAPEPVEYRTKAGARHTLDREYVAPQAGTELAQLEPEVRQRHEMAFEKGARSQHGSQKWSQMSPFERHNASRDFGEAYGQFDYGYLDQPAPLPSSGSDPVLGQVYILPDGTPARWEGDGFNDGTPEQ